MVNFISSSKNVLSLSLSLSHLKKISPTSLCESAIPKVDNVNVIELLGYVVHVCLWL